MENIKCGDSQPNMHENHSILGLLFDKNWLENSSNCDAFFAFAVWH